MTKHSSRDVRGRFAKVDPERDVLAPDLGVPGDYAYGMERRHGPSADSESEPGGARSPYEITDAQGPEAWAAPYADAFPGPVPHDPARGPYQRPLPHRQQMMVDGGTGQQLDVTQSRAIGPDMRTVPSSVESVRYADEAGAFYTPPARTRGKILRGNAATKTDEAPVATNQNLPEDERYLYR